ncbi:HlyD family secretion protein [Ferrovibrio xuzhouensis]|uniref:HlyD family secretion protein n=1 Tax=Ferrovibrio xuzhouensis TaxID=1576914 RepID=A0ABV7VJ34_9PROT
MNQINVTALRDNPAQAPAATAAAKPRRRLPVRRILLLAGPLLVLAVAAITYLNGGRYVSTDNAAVQAGKSTISTDVAGNVAEIAVRNNQHVKAGDLLFRLDDEPYRIALEGATAQLGVTRDTIEGGKANYRQKLEAIKQVQTDLDFYQREYQRQNDLFKSRVNAQTQLDQARRNLDATGQKLAAARQDAAAVLASLGGKADAPVEQYAAWQQAKAAVDKAARDLRRTRVLAPMDGIVTQVDSLQPGEYLASQQAAMAIVSDRDIWVEANPKETDLTYVRPGNKATVTIDTYPGREWQGVVDSVSPATGAEFSVLPAQNASGNWVKVVQRVPVRVRLELPADAPPLRTGMSAEVEIDTGHSRSLAGILHSMGGWIGL